MCPVFPAHITFITESIWPKNNKGIPIIAATKPYLIESKLMDIYSAIIAGVAVSFVWREMEYTIKYTVPTRPTIGPKNSRVPKCNDSLEILFMLRQ